MKPGRFWAKKVSHKAELLSGGVSLDNFRRDSISKGIDSNSSYKRKHILSMIQQDWETFSPIKHHKLLNDSSRGNPVVWEHDGYRLTRTSIETAYLVGLIEPWIGQRIIEIGPGIGALCRAIKIYRPSIDYTLIDFKPMLVIQRYYLDGFKGLHFLESGSDPGGSVDLFINSRSMMEMDAEEIAHYIHIIEKRLRSGGAFFLVARDKISSFRDYPFDDRWRLEWEKPSPRWETMRQRLLVRL
jgi:hypothetical protein